MKAIYFIFFGFILLLIYQNHADAQTINNNYLDFELVSGKSSLMLNDTCTYQIKIKPKSGFKSTIEYDFFYDNDKITRIESDMSLYNSSSGSLNPPHKDLIIGIKIKVIKAEINYISLVCKNNNNLLGKYIIQLEVKSRDTIEIPDRKNIIENKYSLFQLPLSLVQYVLNQPELRSVCDTTHPYSYYKLAGDLKFEIIDARKDSLYAKLYNDTVSSIVKLIPPLYNEWEVLFLKRRPKQDAHYNAEDYVWLSYWVGVFIKDSETNETVCISFNYYYSSKYGANPDYKNNIKIMPNDSKIIANLNKESRLVGSYFLSQNGFTDAKFDTYFTLPTKLPYKKSKYGNTQVAKSLIPIDNDIFIGLLYKPDRIWNSDKGKYEFNRSTQDYCLTHNTKKFLYLYDFKNDNWSELFDSELITAEVKRFCKNWNPSHQGIRYSEIMDIISVRDTVITLLCKAYQWRKNEYKLREMNVVAELAYNREYHSINSYRVYFYSVSLGNLQHSTPELIPCNNNSGILYNKIVIDKMTGHIFSAQQFQINAKWQQTVYGEQYSHPAIYSILKLNDLGNAHSRSIR